MPDRELDITGEVCPMTFVRTRLALDRLESGQTLLVRLRGEEPLANVPRTARDQGHQVLSVDTGADGVSEGLPLSDGLLSRFGAGCCLFIFSFLVCWCCVILYFRRLSCSAQLVSLCRS